MTKKRKAPKKTRVRVARQLVFLQPVDKRGKAKGKSKPYVVSTIAGRVK